MENFIFYLTDQFRADSLSTTGNEACKNPNMDKLAEESLVYTNAFCQNPVCVPSRCSILSGLYPYTNGHRTMHFLMDEKEDNLLKTLTHNGYDVVWYGKNDCLKESVDLSKYCSEHYDPSKSFYRSIQNGTATPYEVETLKLMDKAEHEWRSQRNHYYSHMRGIQNTRTLNHSDDFILEKAKKYLETYDRKKPFFMFLTGILPHPPYGIEQSYFDMIDDSDIEDPIRLSVEQLEKKASILKGIIEEQKVYELSNEELKILKKIYYAMGTKVDAQIGELVEKLKEQNLYDSTTIIISSDHGDYTGDYGLVEKTQNTFEDCIVNVPLIIKPSITTEFKPHISDCLVELIDIQATILEIANINPGYNTFGKSLTSTFTGGSNHREFVVSYGGRLESEGDSAKESGHQSESEYYPRMKMQQSIPEHSKAIMIRDKKYKYVYRLYERDELYDLNSDPLEINNLIDDNGKYNELVDQYKILLLQKMMETVDVVPQKMDSR